MASKRKAAEVATLAAAMSPRPLGQHFLADPAWRERIARAIVDAGVSAASPGGVWLEIGAGHGEMTALLARHAERVVAIELDARLLPRLGQLAAQLGNVSVISGDVLELDLAKIAGSKRFRVYGNLPYYITSPILHRLFEHADRLEAAFVVVQLEVAARLAARPGRREYGYLSAVTQFYARPEILLRIPPGAFRPAPKVFSALVALRLPGERARLSIGDEHAFLGFLMRCFAQKRKTLRNNLRALGSAATADGILREAGIASHARAEQLTLPQLARLFAAAGTHASAHSRESRETSSSG
jgi:16S rRNA (adenine1518-N6/adenine1519-N6)-dimethyltransferase